MQSERAVRKYNLGGILFTRHLSRKMTKRGIQKPLNSYLCMKKQNNRKLKKNNYDKSYINAENQLH